MERMLPSQCACRRRADGGNAAGTRWQRWQIFATGLPPVVRRRHATGKPLQTDRDFAGGAPPLVRRRQMGGFTMLFYRPCNKKWGCHTWISDKVFLLFHTFLSFCKFREGELAASPSPPLGYVPATHIRIHGTRSMISEYLCLNFSILLFVCYNQIIIAK